AALPLAPRPTLQRNSHVAARLSLTKTTRMPHASSKTANMTRQNPRKRVDSRPVNRDLALERLAEIEAYYNTAPVGLCVLDTELRYVRINQRLAEINGLPVSAHLGRTIQEI